MTRDNQITKEAVELAYNRWLVANIMAVDASNLQTPDDELERLWAIEEAALYEYTRLYNLCNPSVRRWFE